MELELVDTYYDWKSLSLIDFLENNTPQDWLDFFSKSEIQHELENISEKLYDIAQEKVIYPPINQVFRALYMVPICNIKAVIIGQDCYHNGSAVGLCFSVKKGNKINPSLRNIYKELENEGYSPNKNGDLSHWAKQGILLLNMALTVEEGNAGSHVNIWKKFSELLVKYISDTISTDWLLFGAQAHKVTKIAKKGNFHCTSHPMPLSAYKSTKNYESFFGSGVFRRIENIKW